MTTLTIIAGLALIAVLAYFFLKAVHEKNMRVRREMIELSTEDIEDQISEVRNDLVENLASASENILQLEPVSIAPTRKRAPAKRAPAKKMAAKKPAKKKARALN